MIVATVYSNLVAAIVEHALPNHSYWRRAIVGGTAFSLPYFAFVWSLVTYLYPRALLPHPAAILVVIAAITIAVYGVLWGISRSAEGAVQEAVPPPPVPKPNPRTSAGNNLVLSKLGPEAGTRLVRMAMSDHYIEVHTDTGEHLLHMRFADAVAAQDTAVGGQVHRSHWIAWDQVAQVERDGQKRTFVLRDGSRVPVARSRQKELQDRGLI